MLEDEYFMLRVRSDGGALTAAALRTLGGISTEFARDTADISDRQNVQYHWIEVENMPEIWRRLDEVGLQTTEACGDCPRVVLGSPLAGESLDEVIDGTPAINEIVKRYISKPEYSNLPRKFKTAISGLQDVVHEVNDVAFIGVEHPEHGPGFDLWVGGGLSTNPMLGQRVGAWVPIDEVPDVWEAVVSVFRDYGYRRLRAKARLKFLIKDWGVEKFRQVLEDEYLKRKLIDGPAPQPVTRPIDHVGVQKLQERTQRRRGGPDRGPGFGHHPDQGGRPRGVGGQRPHSVHAVPEADHPRRSRRQARRAPRRARRPWLTVAAVALAPQPDGLHRHRVLQALLRRDPQALSGSGAGAGEAAGGHQCAAGCPDHDQHQRLPELLRADPGRRYRVQGPDGRRRRRT